ncbi:B12-binding domain-containing radical SAM protein [Kosmotoga pacifica]|uniref:Radical SAM protein n=1 Tax=Kosmotoga pacifica TaxID=1330330 RepID=A0A0G2ZBM9_9BACT|nr:radical SAM protein [Kosmotoga pacifica]AKI96954.1 radical SAM protein [Kosmotoga pacifica]
MRKPRNSETWREFNKVLAFKETELFLEKVDLNGSLEIALIYPNDYEVASASLSFHHLYEKFNSLPNVRCERFFYNRAFKKFYSLESFKPLDEFRIWAFSVHFELDVLNLIDILLSYKIPLFNEQRNSYHPVVVIGGALTYFSNTLLGLLGDVVHSGDLTTDFLSILGSLTGKEKRDEIIRALKEDPHAVRGEAFSPAISNELSKSVFVTNKAAFGSRFLLEIGRGCKRACKFCVAGYTFGKDRYLPFEELKRVVDSIKTRVNNIGLIAATVTDYPWLKDVVDYFNKEKLGISVSSLRLDALSEELLLLLKNSGQTQFTIAPEGGSQRIRNLFSKGISEEHIYRTLEMGVKVGFKHIKLYYIYGAVFESPEDRKEIVKLILDAKKMGYSQVIASLNPLIPKPGTPFGTLPMEDFNELRKIEAELRDLLNVRGVKGDFESLKESVMQFSIANMTREQAIEFLTDKYSAQKRKRYLLDLAKRINSTRKEWEKNGQEKHSCNR